jgi:hypothetical protein
MGTGIRWGLGLLVMMAFFSTPALARGVYSIPRNGAILGVGSPDDTLRACMKKQEAEFSLAQKSYPDQAFLKKLPTEVDTDVVDFREASSQSLGQDVEQFDSELDAEVYSARDERDKLYLVLNSTARLLKNGQCEITSAKTIMASFDRWKATSNVTTETLAKIEEE